MNAWGGISSLQLRLPVMWTDANARGFSINHLAEWLCTAPARQVGIEHRKGAIAVGQDADIIIWNPSRAFRVEPSLIHHRHKLTPYAGLTLHGVVEKTFLRGRMIYDGGDFVSQPPGQIMLRNCQVIFARPDSNMDF